MSIDVMKQALEALEFNQARWQGKDEAVTALRAAIEHAERPQTHSDGCWRWHHQCAVAKIERTQTQEPVAWMYRGNLLRYDPGPNAQDPVIPLYAGDPL